MKLNESEQSAILSHVSGVYSGYDTLLRHHRKKWLEMFNATYRFEVQNRQGPGQSRIFFPKAFEHVEKVAPRIFGSNPKFVISLNVPINPQNPEADMLATARANQAALNYFWKIGNNSKKTRTATKSLLVYGVVFLKGCVEKKIFKTKSREYTGGKEVTIQKEMIIQEYPTFSVPDLFDIYFDPRVSCVDDMEAIIENRDNVRYVDLLKNKKYFNLDKLKNNIGGGLEGANSDKMNRYSGQGIPYGVENRNVVNIKEYYGYYSDTGKPEDEKLVKITTAADNTILIGYEEIDCMPYEMINAIEVPHQGVGVGLVEPIKQLQDAYMLTRNQRFENVSLVINRMWAYRIGAGVDPRRLVSRAGNVIPVKEVNDIVPIQTPDITGSSFSEAQALNTEMQSTLGTIDSTQDSSSNGFTNLATGQKIRWNEFNVRFKAIKENLEEGLARVGEKMLRLYANEASMNPLIQDESGEFYEVAREAFNSVTDFYRVSILADSTNLDSIENKREEALAFGNLAIAYKAQGVNIPMDNVWKHIVQSFPSKDVSEFWEPGEQQGGSGGRPISDRVLRAAQVQLSPEDQLNQQLTNVN